MTTTSEIFVKLPSNLLYFLKDRGLGVQDRLVFLELMCASQAFYPSQPWLANRLGISTRTVRRAFTVLKKGDFIVEIDRRGFRGGSVPRWSVNPGLRQFAAWTPPKTRPLNIALVIEEEFEL